MLGIVLSLLGLGMAEYIIALENDSDKENKEWLEIRLYEHFKHRVLFFREMYIGYYEEKSFY